MKSLVIVGGAGRMGQALGEGLGARGEFEVVALIDHRQPRELFGAEYVRSLEDLDATRVDVVIDFSSPDGATQSAGWCAAHGVALVVGVTGLSEGQRAALRDASTHVGVVVAANFSIGAVLAEHFSAVAAAHFERVEIIELHHDGKVDAPSGTSLATAVAIAQARERAGRPAMVDPTTQFTREGARGAEVDGVKIHSVRLAGLVAHQEVHFGSPGEGLTIRHDSFDRQSFVRGVALAVDAIDATPRFLDGIGSLVL